ncbi:MAG: polysaccharide biosynthesis protein [Nitrospirae bacterium]|nr:MAG: polysaccharide biosynthesis protein [Nitrospirota bacterium]
MNPTHFKRTVFFLMIDALILSFSLYFSFLLRFEFNIPEVYTGYMLTALPFFVCVKVASFYFFRLYMMTWRFVSINELFNIIKGLLISEMVLMVLIFVPLPVQSSFYPFSGLPVRGFPRSIFLMDAAVSLIFISGLRLSKRIFLEISRKQNQRLQGKKTIIVGAGRTGEMILRDMLSRKSPALNPVGFLDDDTGKTGMYIHGVRVLDTIAGLESEVKKQGVEEVIIAIPSLDHVAIRQIYDTAKVSGVDTIKIVPRIYDLQGAKVNIQDLEDISIEDLIGRQKVSVDYQKIGSFIKGRTVLLTGAGGSIGSEIALQVCGFDPAKLILFDVDETELHNIGLKIKKTFPQIWVNVVFVVGDIKERERVRDIFGAMRPGIVFHAAAYKHVPMMEYNPSEAVKVNISGTFNLAEAAADFGVGKFIMISTDKAVRPTSVMGATKRVAEYICNAFNGRGDTAFVSVRFGNVLGSRGSVLPLFMEQLKHGGPLSVTHKDMRRYFMTIPEAVSLVLQASVIGAGGQILVLDMGEPVKIVKLAEELIRMHGLEPYRDIDIEIVGMRPGEKLFEEILTAEEGTVSSPHEKIFIANSNEKFSLQEIGSMLDGFKRVVEGPYPEREERVRAFLKKHVRYWSDDQAAS